MIKVYVLPNCPRCEDFKKYMKNKGINFIELDVEKNPKALAKMTIEGIEQYPVIEINGRIYKEGLNDLKNIVISSFNRL